MYKNIVPQQPAVKGYTELAPPLTGSNIRENWFFPSLTGALRRVSPIPHLGSTIELTVFIGAKRS